MDVYNEIYEGFMRAFRYCVDKEGYGGRSFLAAKVGISTAMMSKILHKTNPKPISKNLQVKLANACGYELTEFIEFGRNLLSEKDKKTQNFELVQPDEKIEVSPSIDATTLEHMEIVKKFKYKDRLKKINEDLLVIEQNAEALREVEAYIRGLATGIRLSSGDSGSRYESRPEGKLKNGTGGTE